MGRLLTTEEFIEKARKVHGDKYDYSITVYKGRREKIDIICPIHGKFTQNAGKHLNGAGCEKCGYIKTGISQRDNKETFIAKAKSIHGEKYDYSKVQYTKSNEKVCLICHEKTEDGREHGEFYIRPNNLITGYGCPKCGKHFLDTELFIYKAKKVHGDKYDYSKTKFVDSKTPVTITCKKHGDFQQLPHNHLSGKGCRKCATISYLEDRLELFLIKNSIKYEPQKHFPFLGKQSLDFYLPGYNIAIECQGRQHFYGEKNAKYSFEDCSERDERKQEILKEHNIRLIYITKEKCKIDESVKHLYSFGNNLFEITYFLNNFKNIIKKEDEK